MDGTFAVKFAKLQGGGAIPWSSFVSRIASQELPPRPGFRRLRTPIIASARALTIQVRHVSAQLSAVGAKVDLPTVCQLPFIGLFLLFSLTAFSQAAAPQLGVMEASLLKQRDSITLQIASLKKMNPGAFNITRVPGDEPVTQLARRSDCNGGSSGSIEPVISLAASRAGISSNLVRAVILQESAFDPCAVSSKGALGLMQLMPATARQLGVSNPFDPKQNVEAGAGLLRQLIDRYGGDLSLALSAYNAGPARVDRAGGVPNIAETTNYVRSVLANLKVE